MTTSQLTYRDRVLKAAASMGLIGSDGATLSRLLAMRCDVRTSRNEVAATIEQHPVLCARVLRVSNSAYYGQQRSITTVKRAIFVLGLDAIRGVAAAACLDRAVPRGAQLLPDMAAFLSHTLATAVAAELLARDTARSLGSEAFIAGVLHNLGVPVQACLDPVGVQTMVRRRDQHPTLAIRALESDYASVRHEECVAIVLDDWQLPQSLVAAAGHHHAPLEAPEPDRMLAALVNLGASIALASGHTYSLEPVAIEHSAEAMMLLKLTPPGVEKVQAQMRPLVDAMRGAMDD